MELDKTTLIKRGEEKLQWVAKRMKVLNYFREKMSLDKPFSGLNVAICVHLEAKTAYLAMIMRSLGASVWVTGSNPLSTQDDVALALSTHGINVFAKHTNDMDEYRRLQNEVLDAMPNVIIDDGGDLTAAVHSNRVDVLKNLYGICEETTTGVIRLKALEREERLKVPAIAVNNGRMKNLFDNRYGTGQSTWDGIMRTTNLSVCGKTVVVGGYGWCGKGIARRAAGLGANVIVTEMDPVKAIEALMDGFRVMKMEEAAPIGDFFVTATGDIDVVGEDALKNIKDGAVLANSGHFDVEISKPALKKLSVSKKTVRDNVEEYTFKDGRKVYLLADGRLVNLVAGDGHPVEIMDTTFALQLLSAKYVVEHHERMKSHVYEVPKEIDEEVARAKLKTLGVSIGVLSDAQRQYLGKWK